MWPMSGSTVSIEHLFLLGKSFRGCHFCGSIGCVYDCPYGLTRAGWFSSPVDGARVPEDQITWLCEDLDWLKTSATEPGHILLAEVPIVFPFPCCRVSLRVEEFL